MWIGWVLGIFIITPETAGVYSVSVLFLLKINDSLQKFLRQLIVLESMMVSVERTFILKDLPAEKELRTNYDEMNQIAYDGLKIDQEEAGVEVNSSFEAMPEKWPS